MSQEEAWDNLELAIAQFLDTTGLKGILSDWVLVSHVLTEMNDDGSLVSTSIQGSRNQPAYRALGLLEYGAAAIRAGAVENEED